MAARIPGFLDEGFLLLGGNLVKDLFQVRVASIQAGHPGIQRLISKIHRIHDKDIQTRVFGVIDYGEDEIQDRFGQLLTAFTYGAPPHGGMGLGLDRLVAILAGEQAIREVIAFPKTQSAVDPLFEAPAIITDQQLEELHIRVVMPEN